MSQAVVNLSLRGDRKHILSKHPFGVEVLETSNQVAVDPFYKAFIHSVCSFNFRAGKCGAHGF